MKVWLQIMEAYENRTFRGAVTMAEIKKLTGAKSPPLGRILIHILGFEKKDSASGVFLYHPPRNLRGKISWPGKPYAYTAWFSKVYT